MYMRRLWDRLCRDVITQVAWRPSTQGPTEGYLRRSLKIESGTCPLDISTSGTTKNCLGGMAHWEVACRLASRFSSRRGSQADKALGTRRAPRGQAMLEVLESPCTRTVNTRVARRR